MDVEMIETCFRSAAGNYAFARWNRPIAPVIFGVQEGSLPVLKGAIEAVASLAGVEIAETDPEFGSNCMVFFLRDWDELSALKDMDRLVPDMENVVAQLRASDAASYRFFRYDDAGGIRAAFLFLRMVPALAEQSAQTIALTNAVQVILTWGPEAFVAQSPLGIHPESGTVVLKPEFADVIRAAYDPVMPVAADDASHALRLAARVGASVSSPNASA